MAPNSYIEAHQKFVLGGWKYVPSTGRQGQSIRNFYLREEHDLLSERLLRFRLFRRTFRAQQMWRIWAIMNMRMALSNSMLIQVLLLKILWELRRIAARENRFVWNAGWNALRVLYGEVSILVAMLVFAIKKAYDMLNFHRRIGTTI